AGTAPTAVVFSRYPVLYADPFSDRPRERNLVELLPRLRDHGPLWHAVVLSIWPWQLLRRGTGVRAAFVREQIVPLLLFATPGELLAAALALRQVRRVGRCRRATHALDAHFTHWDISQLWRAEVDFSLTNLELPSNLMLRQAMRRLALTHEPRIVIHPCEFQPMERAIWAGLAGTGTRSVAFQHATVSSNALSYFFAKGEIELALSGEDRLASPLPDYYLTTGDWPLEIMRSAGYPSGRSAVVGPVRYNRLLEAVADAD